MFLLKSMCSEHEIISHWHPLSWKSSEFLYLLTLSGIILGFESLPKYNSRQGRHLGVFMILFKYLCTSITWIIVISGHRTAWKSRVSASGSMGCAIACPVATHSTACTTVSMELHQGPGEASECLSIPCRGVSLLVSRVSPPTVCAISVQKLGELLKRIKCCEISHLPSAHVYMYYCVYLSTRVCMCTRMTTFESARGLRSAASSLGWTWTAPIF